jgi:glycosyltransferase involved in cell wall biosynthesis
MPALQVESFSVDRSAITVILPTCDRPGFLAAAVRSVMAQQLVPEEVLVVDDGAAQSAEETLQPIMHGAGLLTRVIAGPRQGPAAARNVGWQSARGQLIAFLDDDDLWHPRKLAWQASWFSLRPGLGLLGTQALRLPPSPAAAGADMGAVGRGADLPQAPAPPRPVSRWALLRANRLPMSSVLVRRCCLEQSGGFDEALPLAQDWDLWLRIAERWQVASLPAPLTIYRIHPGQRSQDGAAMRLCEAEVMRRALARAPGAQTGRWSCGGAPGALWLRAAARRRLSWAHYRLGRVLLRRGEPAEAVREFRAALSLSPLHPLVWGSLARCVLAARALAGGVGP